MPISIADTDLLYFPAPKVACSSIKQAILVHNDPVLGARIPERTPDGRTIRHIHHVYPSSRFRPWAPLQYRGFRWFCVVRDPLKRFLSAYSNRVLFHDDITRNDADKAKAAGLSCRPEPEEFARSLEAYCRISGAIKHHVRPQTDYIGWFPHLYDRVFRLSEIENLSEYCAEAGAKLDIPHVQTGGPKIPLSDLSNEMQEKLRRYYWLDYRLYGAFLD